jgi:drug/metabolite transporter (DMT)-like permease
MTSAPAETNEGSIMKLISSKTHTYIGWVVGVVLVVAPWIFQFDEVSPAKWSAILVGLFIIVNEAVTTSPSSPMKIVPMRVHIMLDVVTGIFLALTPFLFQFSDEDANSWVPHIVVGILIAGYALVTDTSDASDAAGTDGMNNVKNRTR